MKAVEWVFSGIGTSLLSAIIGFIFGGVTGYKIGIRSNIRQKPKAGDNSNQNQIGQIVNNGNK